MTGNADYTKELADLLDAEQAMLGALLPAWRAPNAHAFVAVAGQPARLAVVADLLAAQQRLMAIMLKPVAQPNVRAAVAGLLASQQALMAALLTPVPEPKMRAAKKAVSKKTTTKKTASKPAAKASARKRR